MACLYYVHFKVKVSDLPTYQPALATILFERSVALMFEIRALWFRFSCLNIGWLLSQVGCCTNSRTELDVIRHESRQIMLLKGGKGLSN
jgi:hypothetical protein